MQEEAVRDGAEEGRERVGRKVGRHGAAFLSDPREVAHRSAEVVQQAGQARAQNRIALGFEHRLGPDSRYELLLLGLLAQEWLEQGDEVRQLLERLKLCERECLLERVQRGLGQQLLFAAEVVAHGAVRQPGPSGHGTGRDAPPADLGDQLRGSAQQPSPRFVRTRSPTAKLLSIWTVHMANSCSWSLEGPDQNERTIQMETTMTSVPTPAIEAIGLTRLFGHARAVDGLDLSVPAGLVYGLLGPNGAGKTTSIRMLATLLRPDGGTARVFGKDIVREADAVRRHVSLTGQFASVDGELTSIENLVLLGRLLGLSRRRAKARASELLETFDLTDTGDRQVMKLSGGMRRRLDIAASLITRPDLLFLDEPTTGLDPRSRRQTWEIVRAIVANGTTVVLTTQYLDEADQLSDRIAVIDHGKVIAEGTSTELKSTVGASTLKLELLDPAQRTRAEHILGRALQSPVRLDRDPSAISARITAPGGELPARATSALAELVAAGVGVHHFALGQPTLDEAFLALTGQPAEEPHDAQETR
jgi:ABC-2 type transport system ATP-binding protein